MTHPAIANLTIPPMDRYNQELVANVHPADWVNPSPTEVYDLVVLGAGPAGLIVAAGAAGLGARVALVEKHLMGGDCLNVGCIPSKCMIRSSRVAALVNQADAYGIHVSESSVNFSAVMERLRRVRASISPVDSAERYQTQLKADVFLGEGKFISDRAIAVGEQTLSFRKAVIATGARAAIPDIPGLADVDYLTNETVFNLTEQPQRLAIIGGGPIGCELGQAFQRLGTHVTLIHRKPHVLDRDDPEAVAILERQLRRDGVNLVLNATIERVTSQGSGAVIHYSIEGQPGQVEVDAILIGAGRSPNVEGLNLEAAGVRYTAKGVVVNDLLQTSNPRIFAAGDICMAWKFTHAADAAARIVIKNALFSPFGLGMSKLSQLVVPWVTYTEPEIAHVGLHAHDAEQQGVAINTMTVPLKDLDRAITDGETDGFVKIHVKQGSDTILGATVVAAHAGDMINEITMAMVHRLGLGKLASVIHPYPTQAEAIKKAADAYRKTLLTPRTARFLKLILRLSRRLS